MPQRLLLDFGSTYTKAVLLSADGELLSRAAVPTTVHTDVMDGYQTLVELMRERGFAMPRTPAEGISDGTLIACSSAGGGLRLAVVGYEEKVTAEAGYRVGLSAGAKVVHVAFGELDAGALSALRATAPDVILLVGGTDGGNSEVLLHNAATIAAERAGIPVVVAGNAHVAGQVADLLEASGGDWVLADNVVPMIGTLEPESARAAIRGVFLEHVIGGKGLSRGTDFAQMVRAATPDAMLTGVQAMASAIRGDVLVVDIGGATTDVYSVLDLADERPGAKQVVAPMAAARTVEGDLGMRWNAPTIVEAATLERLEPAVPLAGLATWAREVHDDTSRLPETPTEQEYDLALARLAALVAVRRHARPGAPGEAPRALGDVAHIVGSGGVLRHTPDHAAADILRAVASDYAGGWRTPTEADVSVDVDYLLFAAGLLTGVDDAAAAVAARQVADRVGKG